MNNDETIKSFHYELKGGVFEDRANGYAIGDYKKRNNTVGGLKGANPSEVAEQMKDHFIQRMLRTRYYAIYYS